MNQMGPSKWGKLQVWFLGLLFSLPVCGQNLTFPVYRQYINEAEYWSYLWSFDTSSQMLDYAFQHSEFIPMALDVYHAAYPAARSNKKQMCLQYLKKAADTQIEWVKHGIVTRDAAVFANCLDEDYAVFRNFMDSLYRQPGPALLRETYYEKANHYVTEDQKYLALNNEDNLDIFHAKLLAEIEENGYPGLKRAGTDVLSIVFHHIGPLNFEYAFHLFYDAMIAGEVSPHEYAIAMDYFVIRTTGNVKGLYGCHQSTTLKAEDFSLTVQNRLDLGVSIFFQKPTRTPWIAKTQTPWINDSRFISRYFIFKNLQK